MSNPGDEVGSEDSSVPVSIVVVVSVVSGASPILNSTEFCDTKKGQIIGLPIQTNKKSKVQIFSQPNA